MGAAMNDNVINFKPRKFEQVYECECGNQVFYLTISMECECSLCGKSPNNLRLTTEPHADDT